MNVKESAGSKLLASIDKEFIEIVGPIGSLIIEDTRLLWRKKGWKGPSALRHYVTELAKNIDDNSEKQNFIQAASKLAMAATSARNSV
jgi:hypothetical protein